MPVTVVSRLKIKNAANEPIAEGPDIAASCAVVANTAARDAILTNVRGSSYLVYRVDLPGFEYWNGSTWTAAGGGSGAGGGIGFPFTYSTTTTDSDPGNGTFRANNATLSSASQLFVDIEEFGTSDVSDWLDQLDDGAGATKGILRLQSKSDATKWIEYYVTGVTLGSGYRKIAVTFKDQPSGFSGLTTAAGDTRLSFDQSPTGLLLADGSVPLSAPWDVGNQRIDDVRSVSYEGETDTGNSGTSHTIDFTTGALQKNTLTANCTYSFTAPQPWTAIQLRIVQDATGGRTVTWPGSVVWDKGYAPVMAGGPNSETIISGYYDGTNYRLTNPDRGMRLVTETGTTRTLVATDANADIDCTHGSGCTVTVPPHSSVPFELGTVVLFEQSGAAQVTLAAGVGVTLTTSETLKTLKQHSVIGIIKKATNTWKVFGEREIA